MIGLIRAIYLGVLSVALALATIAPGHCDELYNALWLKSQEDRPAVWGWARADFDKRHQELARQGYRLQDLHSYMGPGWGQTFNAIWVKSQDDRPAVWGWARADFDKRFAELAAQGYRLATLNAFVSKSGDVAYNAIWTKSQEDRPAVWGWRRADFDKKAADMATQGYRLASLSAYVDKAGAEHFNAIWVKSQEDRPAVWAWARADFDKKQAEMAAAGYRLLALNVYVPWAGKEAFNAIWTKSLDEQGVVWGWARADFDKKQTDMAAKGFRLAALNAFVPAKLCAISGRLVGGQEYWKLTSIGVRGPGDFSRRPAPPVQVGGDGTYAFAGLPRGMYKVYPDIRADLGTGFKPAQRNVFCISDSSAGVDFEWPKSAATQESAGIGKAPKGLGKE